MPQYWLKPFGTTEPPRFVEPDWTIGADLDSYAILSGPSTPRNPPQMGRTDRVLFHAVGHVHIYAVGEILDTAHNEPHPVWGHRCPWVYPVRVDVWVDNVFEGPRTTEVAPQRVVGRIMAGASYAKLTPTQYQALLSQLLAAATVRVRPGFLPPP